LKQENKQSLALVVRQGPYEQRSPRAQLDVALAAAALEIPLEIYFLGDGVWQLAVQRSTRPANLPRGLKGWAALDQMTQVMFFAEVGRYQNMQELGVETVVPLKALDNGAMADRWRDCRQVMAL
jgi:hypothetical protein